MVNSFITCDSLKNNYIEVHEFLRLCRKRTSVLTN